MDDQTLKTGTTTIGIVTSEGVVLASERRATMGNIIAHKEVQKVFKIDDNLGMTIAGVVGHAQLLTRYVKAEVQLYRLKKGSPMTVKAASTLVANIVRNGFYVGLIVGGWDRNGGHVYSIDGAGGSIEDKYVSVGSGSVFSLGVLENGYKDDLSLDGAVDLAIASLNASMRRDSASGNGMMVVTVNDKGFTEVPEDELITRTEKLGFKYPN
ncbi:MAG: archaeal proteasome endopeptidase complex subunit beta [Candidatus Methanomethylophilaceae archaeon]